MHECALFISYRIESFFISKQNRKENSALHLYFVYNETVRKWLKKIVYPKEEENEMYDIDDG